MDIDVIQSSQVFRQKEFPVTRDKIYLAHAAVAPLPARVARAIVNYINRASERGQFEYLHKNIEEQARHLAAKLVDASPEEIAFVPSTSAGLSLIASGLDWQVGDNVVIADGDFPANIYPWLNLQRRGVEVRFIPRNRDGAVTLADIKSLLDGHTQLVSLSSVHFVTGAPIDMAGIGEFLREKGILFCVDAIQSLGAFPCRATYVDFLVADAHKWLLGPQGIGLLFAQRRCWDRFYPPLVGWKTVRSPKEFLNIKLEFPDSAKRYEPGSLNVLGIVGLHAALSMIFEMGLPQIAEQIKLLTTTLAEGLQHKGYTLLGAPSSNAATGITSFKHREKEIEPVYQKLNENDIVVSLRDDLTGDKCIRVSPHFYNTQNEIEILLDSVWDSQ